MAQNYRYRPLDTTSAQIRLVQLLPGNDYPVRIKLFICPLTEVAFNALSYTWGDMNNLNSIECDGYTIQVTQNLFLCLRSLRRSGHVEPLWVDSISINQADNAEKGHTLSQMPLIYHTAQRTLCWTGAEHLTFLQKLTSTTLEVGDYQRAMVECLSEVDILHSMYRIAEHDLEVFGKEAKMFDSNTWHNLDAFLNQVYFNRYVQFFSRLLHWFTKY
jgi:hypothetical protein